MAISRLPKEGMTPANDKAERFVPDDLDLELRMERGGHAAEREVETPAKDMLAEDVGGADDDLDRDLGGALPHRRGRPEGDGSAPVR